MTKARQTLGKTGEEIALRHLKGLGYRVLERNYRCPLGEIDLIAHDGDCLVFVEIKTRRGNTIAEAKGAVGPIKQKKLARLALYYLKKMNSINTKSRFDVVAVCINDNKQKIELIKNAFDALF